MYSVFIPSIIFLYYNNFTFLFINQNIEVIKLIRTWSSIQIIEIKNQMKSTEKFKLFRFEYFFFPFVYSQIKSKESQN